MMGVTMRFINYSLPTSRGTELSKDVGGRWSPSRIDREIEFLFGTALEGFSGPLGGGQFPVDLYEDKDNTYVRAELPGVARDAISVEVVDGSLSIQATRTDKSGEAEKTVSYSRLVSIPDQVQPDKVTAAYENGLLTVTLPRKEESKPKKISVTVN